MCVWDASIADWVYTALNMRRGYVLLSAVRITLEDYLRLERTIGPRREGFRI